VPGPHADKNITNPTSKTDEKNHLGKRIYDLKEKSVSIIPELDFKVNFFALGCSNIRVEDAKKVT
jgi:hypothetical protein